MVFPAFGAGATVPATISKYWYATHILAVTLYASQNVYNWISPTVVVKPCEMPQEIVQELEEGWFNIEISGKKPSIIESIPRVSLQFPSSTQIAERMLTTFIVDAPIYTIKTLYQSPLLTTLLIYYIKM